jgi:hypothetical protein
MPTSKVCDIETVDADAARKFFSRGQGAKQFKEKNKLPGMQSHPA